MKLYTEVKVLGEGKQLKSLKGKTNLNIIRIGSDLNEKHLVK